MKKIFYSFMVLACVMLLTSCSSDDEPKWEDKYPDVDKQLVDNLKNGSASKLFHQVDLEAFQRPDKNSEWEHTDDLLVGLTYGTGFAEIKHGKVVVPFSLFSISQGRNLVKISYVWSAYCRETNTKESFFLYSTFGPDTDNMILGTEDKDYKLEKLSESEMVISEEVNDNFMVRYRYEMDDKSNWTDVYKSAYRQVMFETRNEVFQYIIDKAREQFGDKIDFNELYGKDNYLFPIIDLNELQRELDNNNIR